MCRRRQHMILRFFYELISTSVHDPRGPMWTRVFDVRIYNVLIINVRVYDVLIINVRVYDVRIINVRVYEVRIYNVCVNDVRIYIISPSVTFGDITCILTFRFKFSSSFICSFVISAFISTLIILGYQSYHYQRSHFIACIMSSDCQYIL